MASTFAVSFLLLPLFTLPSKFKISIVEYKSVVIVLKKSSTITFSSSLSIIDITLS